MFTPNAFKYLTVLLYTQISFLATAPLSFISVTILCEFAMVPDVYILLPLLEEEMHASFWGYRCSHLAAHSSKRLDPLSVIKFFCLGSTSKSKTAIQHCFAKCLGQFIYNFIRSLHYEDEHNTNKKFNCVMVGIIRPSNTSQFQYFWNKQNLIGKILFRDIYWNINKYLWAIFCQLSFKTF